jgi:MerR family transcriptional regulator, copper efflux regulator
VIQSRLSELAAAHACDQVVPFGMRELYRVFILSDGNSLVRNLYGRTTRTGGAECNFDRFHKSSPPLFRLIHLKPRFKVKGALKKMLTIGNVAKRVGVQPSAIRYYERQGMFQPTLRGANGYRTYSDDAVKLLLFVKRAQSLGITLKEIKPLLNLAIEGQRPCSHVKQLAKQHLDEVSQKIRELELLRHDLSTLLKRKAGRHHANEVCPLIEGA